MLRRILGRRLSRKCFKSALHLQQAHRQCLFCVYDFWVLAPSKDFQLLEEGQLIHFLGRQQLPVHHPPLGTIVTATPHRRQQHLNILLSSWCFSLSAICLTSDILLHISFLSFLLHFKGFFPTAQPCLLTPHTMGTPKSWDPACWDLIPAVLWGTWVKSVSSERYTDHFSVCFGYSTSLSFLILPFLKIHFVYFYALIALSKNSLKGQVCEEYASVHSFLQPHCSSPPQGTNFLWVFPPISTPDLEPHTFQLSTLWSHISAQPFHSPPLVQNSITTGATQYSIIKVG